MIGVCLIASLFLDALIFMQASVPYRFVSQTYNPTNIRLRVQNLQSLQHQVYSIKSKALKHQPAKAPTRKSTNTQKHSSAKLSSSYIGKLFELTGQRRSQQRF